MLETKRRLQEGNLTVGAVLVPFLAVVIGCNLVAHAAQMFFLQSVAFGAGEDMPNHLLLQDFPQRILSALGALVPAAVVALLPSRTFAPFGRGATVASIFVIVAAWAFYGAAISVAMYFPAGLVAATNPKAGITIFVLLGFAGTLLIAGLMIWFWFRVERGVLQLTRGAFALVTICALASLLGLAWVVAMTVA